MRFVIYKISIESLKMSFMGEKHLGKLYIYMYISCIE